MSKTNDTSKLNHATLDDHGTLADSELGAVTGGTKAKGGFGFVVRGTGAGMGQRVGRQGGLVVIRDNRYSRAALATNNRRCSCVSTLNDVNWRPNSPTATSTLSVPVLR